MDEKRFEKLEQLFKALLYWKKDMRFTTWQRVEELIEELTEK